MDQQQQHDMMMTYKQQQQLQMLQQQQQSQQQMLHPHQQQQQQQYIQAVSQTPVPPTVPAGIPFYGQQQQPGMVSLGGVYHFIDDTNINPSTNTNYYATVNDSNNNATFANSNIQMNNQSGGGRVATAPGTTMVMMMPSPVPLQQQQVFPANRSRAVSTGSLLLPQASPMQQQQLHYPFQQQQQQQQQQQPAMIMPSQQQTFTPTGTNSTMYIGATQPSTTTAPSLLTGSTAIVPTLPHAPFLAPPPLPTATGDSSNISEDFNQQQQNHNDGIETSAGQALTLSSSMISIPHQLPPKPSQPKLQIQESTTADTNKNVDNTNIGGIDSAGIMQLQQQHIKDQHEMDIARRKLELLQEKVEVDQELLKQDKRNFKRRFKAAKLAIQKSQESIQESIRQDEEMKRQQLTHQFENQIKEIKKKTERMKNDQKKVIQELQEQVQKLEQEVIIRAKEEEERIQEILQKQKFGRGHERSSTRSSFRDSITSNNDNCTSNNGQQSGEDVSEHDQLNNKLQQLQQIVDDQQMTIESYEMQLLELERATDTDGFNASFNATGTESSGKHDVDNITFGVPGKRNERLLRESQAKIDALKSKLEAVESKYKEQVNLSKSLQDQLRKQEEEIQLQVHASGLNEQKKTIQLQYEALVKDMDQMKIKHSNSLHANEQRMQNEISELNRRNESLLKQLEDQRKQYQSAMNSFMAKDGSKHTTSNIRTSSNSGASNAGEIPNVVIPDPTIHIQVYEYEWESDKNNKGTSLTGTYTGWINKETKNPDGNGTLRVDDGTIYEGDWYNGQFHGIGVYATIDGDLYTGQWSLGKRSGQGVQVWSDGRVYRGPFVNDKRHGDDGTMTWPYGAYYTGQFQNNKRNGYGCYRYADGRYYIGNYQDERPHGYGILWKTKPSDTSNIHDLSSISKINKNDILYDGQWQLGEFIGPEDSKSQSS